MPQANFFDKISLSAAQRINGYDRSAFEDKLQSNCIGIVYGDNSLETAEGRSALDLTVRVLSRLYPNLRFFDLSKGVDGDRYSGKLKDLATNINPNINYSDEQTPTINLVIGEVPGFDAQQTCIYIGSQNWVAFYSSNKAQSCHDTNNPFGAGCAVCFGAANVFRYIFREELGNASPDTEFCFSAFSQRLVEKGEFEPNLPSSLSVDFTLIGTGAIGNAVIWSLLELQGLCGRITVVDDQTVALSNLQRYILMLQEHVEQQKVSVIRNLLEKHSELQVEPLQLKWQNAANTLDKEQIKLVVTAIDTTQERLEIQSLLPKEILNAWTSPEGIGISRHLNFTEDVCLSCLYLPRHKIKSNSEKIAASLGNIALEPFIRQYLANNLPIDDNFVTEISQQVSIDAHLLYTYIGQPVEIFYSEAICGGRVIQSGSNEQMNTDLEVPLAHESVLAGLLLGAEVVIQSAQLRETQIEPLTKINMMQPIYNNLLEQESKHYSGLCICQDPIFTNRYRDKWVK
ncbi:E2 ligase fold family C protein [Pontibacter pudoricolor]|uniref:E2 ligase fold family C protein n=1 Tax=Pontibacter pudoricolor TaxID=2694930 RepID=UPI001391DF58|nr:E2 ligase fold family C protein [Pontibacter pudoricolor]